MSVFASARSQISASWSALTATSGNDPSWWQTVLRGLGSVANSVDYMLNHPASDIVNAVGLISAIVTGNGTAFTHALERLTGYTVRAGYTALDRRLITIKGQLEKQIVELRSDVVTWIFQTSAADEAYTRQQVKAEAIIREQRIRAAERLAAQLDRALHQAIEHEAASGYARSLGGRLGLLSRITSLLAADNPLMRGLLKRIETGLLDLASIDSAPARLLLGFLIKRVLVRLGLDKAVGDLLDRLAGPILRDPRPKDLAGVIYDIGERLGALETQWADFFDNGGSEIEQAGREWKATTSAVTDIALLAFFGQQVIAPATWAREVSDVLGPVVTGTMTGIADHLRKG